jgi:hypothetical protein
MSEAKCGDGLTANADPGFRFALSGLRLLSENECVSRARCSMSVSERCTADPGPRLLRKLGPGSAPHHFAALVLRRIRGTQAERPVACSPHERSEMRGRRVH